MQPSKSWILPGVLVGAMTLVAGALVLGTIRRPEPPTWPATSPRPVEPGEALVGPAVYTVDASEPGRWRFFDFSRGSVVEGPGPRAWDLAFRRNEVVVNGGELPGEGGAARVDGPFDAVESLPADGYEGSVVRRDTTSPAFDAWYDYGFTTHLLTPKPVVWAIRTADGRYAKMEILGYYGPGARAGYLTFRYVYQGDGSRSVAAPRDSVTAFHSSTRSALIDESRAIRASIPSRSSTAASSRALASSRSPVTRR